LSPEEEDRRVADFLLLTAKLGDTERQGGGAERQAGRRRAIENDVEAIIEGRLTAVLEEADLHSSLPLFPDARWVFPPVDVEFGEPPAVLAISRRDRIELVVQRSLKAPIDERRAAGKEREAEQSGELSALVRPLSGVATYPSLVSPREDYQSLVATVAHEWVHHYLAFKPLGLRVAASVELRSLNETVADLAAAELARLVVSRYPLPQDAARQLQLRSSPERPLIVQSILQRLRVEVDGRLARGEVAEAEALMEQRRRELQRAGARFRRINQAFFAFRGIYAGDAPEADPLEADVRTLYESSRSVGAFLRSASGLTSAGDLRRLVEDRATPRAGTER
jgi:hypothetical protein